MDQFDDQRRDDMDTGLWRRHHRPGHASRSPIRRRWPGWLLLAVAGAAIAAGVVAGLGLLLAVGLVVAAVAVSVLAADTGFEHRHRPHR
ncbi:hypothetical protein [Micromonospora sp. CPCC 206061]|uniref:hypothetical protein n=1 Tax=Micromonospora sp. CPCC 206061 TaxID=3122410 RepID=UPI002FEEBB3A